MNRLLTWLPWVFFGAVCLAYLWRTLARSDEPARLAVRWGISAIIIALMWFGSAKALGASVGGGMLGAYALAMIIASAIAAGGITLGILWGRPIGELVARPFTGLFDDNGMELKPTPLYSTAIAHRKQARYRQALEEIEEQLRRFPNDFEGSLLRAEIHAVNLHDLDAAEAALDPWLQASVGDAGQQAIALTNLANWHLRFSGSQQRARELLQEIVDRNPESEAAFLAEQRLAHFDFETQPRSDVIHLESGGGRPVDVGVPPSVPESSPEPEVNELLRHLEEHPHDLAARERLAILYAWTFQRADLARDQMQTLLAMKQAAPREVAHWFNLLADIEVQVARDTERARTALQQIIERNPNSAAAEQAKSRILFLPRELKRHQRPPVVQAKAASSAYPKSGGFRPPFAAS